MLSSSLDGIELRNKELVLNKGLDQTYHEMTICLKFVTNDVQSNTNIVIEIRVFLN